MPFSLISVVIPFAFAAVSITIVLSCVLTFSKRNKINEQIDSELENNRRKMELEKKKIEQQERLYQESAKEQQSYTCPYCGTTYKGKNCPSCGASKKIKN